jgi:hypothetical protein
LNHAIVKRISLIRPVQSDQRLPVCGGVRNAGEVHALKKHSEKRLEKQAGEEKQRPPRRRPERAIFIVR